MLRSLPRAFALCAGLAAALGGTAPAGPAAAEEIGADLAAKLTPAQRTLYLAYRKAREQFERQHRIYWSRIDAKREARKAKRLLGQPATEEDYIAQNPRKYAGP